MDIVDKIKYIIEDKEKEEYFVRDDIVMAFLRTQIYGERISIQKEPAWKLVKGTFEKIEREQFEKLWHTLLYNGFLVKSSNGKDGYFEWAFGGS